MSDKIVEGGWYQNRSMFIHVTKILNKDWSDIHVMILRETPGALGRKEFLHEWKKQQYTPEGQWPGIMGSVITLPDGPTQEILDALEWPSDIRGYRSLPRKSDWK